MEFALLLVFALCGEILTRYGVFIALGIIGVTLFSGFISHSSGGNARVAAKRGFACACAVALVGIILTVCTVLSQPW